jgi:hypothetical protein
MSMSVHRGFPLLIPLNVLTETSRKICGSGGHFTQLSATLTVYVPPNAGVHVPDYAMSPENLDSRVHLREKIKYHATLCFHDFFDDAVSIRTV